MNIKLELTQDAYRQMNRAEYKAARSYVRMVEKHINKISGLEEAIDAGLCDLMAFGKASFLAKPDRFEYVDVSSQV